MSEPPRRRVAVAIDGPLAPAWQARAVEAIRASPRLQLVELRIVGRAARGRARRLHAAGERHLLRRTADALRPVPIEGATDRPRAGAPAAELLVWLSERAPGDVEQAALGGSGPGVVYMRHGRRCEPAEDALRRAILGAGAPVESEVLLASTAGVAVVERTVSPLRAFSLTLSLELMLWKLATTIVRATERAAGAATPAEPDLPAARAPAFAALLGRAALVWGRVLTARAVYSRPWSVRVRRLDDAAGGRWSDGEGPVRFTAGHLYADPLLFEHEGRHHLFCEEVAPGERNGVISHTELVLDGPSASPPAPVLRAAHHLSYPFVFAHGGDVFMIPETASVRRVELYRAVEFPHSWRREAVLLEGLAATDATLLFHGGLIWLFASVAQADASSLDELHLFFAGELHGPWLPHPRNPVVSDARCARPAGAVLREGSRLVRPGQDGSRRYGGAVTFSEIDVLSTTDYAEHEVARLEASDVAGARATHTYSRDAALEAIDLRARRARLGRR
jgi:hypothetical protein